MKRLALTLPFAALMLNPAAVGAEDAAPDDGTRWWGHVQVLAGDDMEGRGTGTPGYDRAADYVIGAFQSLGLKPMGTDGYKQPVAFVEQIIRSDSSSAVLLGSGGETPLSVPGDLIFARVSVAFLSSVFF